jgi:hypothetical protein
VPNDQRRTATALERIADALEKIAERSDATDDSLTRKSLADAIQKVLERRDADDNVVDDGDLCKRCGLPEWDCDCDIEPAQLYRCPNCDVEQGGTHDCEGKIGYMVTSPPVYDSFPQVSTQRNGSHFDSVNFASGSHLIASPGAPPPELPPELTNLRLDPAPNPKVKKGDTIRVDGREFEVTEVHRDGGYIMRSSGSTEGLPGTWSHCGNLHPHKCHTYDTGSNEGPYYDVQCLGTPRLPN